MIVSEMFETGVNSETGTISLLKLVFPVLLHGSGSSETGTCTFG